MRALHSYDQINNLNVLLILIIYNRRIRVGNDSINSVIIDDAPSDKHSRVLVAGAVGLNASSDTLLLTNTTLMPNIIGLPALAAILFTPQMEIR